MTKLSGDGREKILELLGEGDFFGEMSLLDNAERSASVKSLTETCILALSRNISQADLSTKDGKWERKKFMGV